MLRAESVGGTRVPQVLALVGDLILPPLLGLRPLAPGADSSGLDPVRNSVTESCESLKGKVSDGAVVF